MSDTPHDLAAVEQLLVERDALHGWLTRLEQAPVAAPEAVRQRVRHDYEQRLDQITNGLRSHADTISSKLRDDRAEHATLLARATAAREALAEAELRYAVGEYDPKRFEAERTRYSSDLETFDLSLAAAGERIERLEEVHALVTRAPRLTAPPMGSEGPQDAGVKEEEPVGIGDLAADIDTDRLLVVFDEPANSEGEAASPSPSPTSTSSSPVPEFGPLSFRPSGKSPMEPARPATPQPRNLRPAAANPAPLGIPAADIPPRFIRPGDRLRSEPPSSSGSETQASADEPVGSATDALFGEEIVATGPTPEAVTVPVGRTLRCGECGAMNRPLEWYCEKCGAELTAV